MKKNSNMKDLLSKCFWTLVALALLFGVPACSDQWDKHYKTEPGKVTDLRLYDFIASQSNLSTFASVLQATGYDSLLNASQFYTVWAPTNDGLAGIDLNDKTLLLNIVKNHVTRLSVSTSGIEQKQVYMLNSKYVPFTKEAEGYAFGSAPVLVANNYTSNGTVHVINGYVPTIKNIWEYIMDTPGLDSMKTYLLENDSLVFDANASIEIGMNSDNQPVYDSVFVRSNEVLNQIGLLDVEDSTYTAILPTNAAWIEAYDRIKSFYLFPTVEGGLGRQREQTKSVLVKDLVFNGRIEEPSAYDSLVSTTYNVLYNPAYLFEGAQKQSLSNGLAYTTDQHRYIDTASWYKEIRVEAEYSLGRTSFNSNTYTRTAYGSGLGVSQNRYALVEATATSQVYVSFTIPNTLSTKYNIYCVFVPSNIENENDILPVKARFQLTYVRTNAGSIFVRSFTSTNFVTDPTKMTKMFVGEFTFPFATLLSSDYPYSTVKTQFRVTNDAGANVNFNSRMRIDCIILEPVK
jgi:hypothetical protein